MHEARPAGLLDWNYIVDRTRNLASNGHWDSPADIIQGAARGYGIDCWEDFPRRVEVWVETRQLPLGLLVRLSLTFYLLFTSSDLEDCAQVRAD